MENILDKRGKQILDKAERLYREKRKEHANRYVHRTHLVVEALEEINKEIEGFGVEAIRHERSIYPLGYYVNMGDTYILTIIFDSHKDAFQLTDLGTWVEEWEKENPENE